MEAFKSLKIASMEDNTQKISDNNLKIKVEDQVAGADNLQSLRVSRLEMNKDLMQSFMKFKPESSHLEQMDSDTQKQLPCFGSGDDEKGDMQDLNELEIDDQLKVREGEVTLDDLS